MFVWFMLFGFFDGLFFDEVVCYWYWGFSGKVNFVLDGLFEFMCLFGVGDYLCGVISFSLSIDYIE